MTYNPLEYYVLLPLKACLDETIEFDIIPLRNPCNCEGRAAIRLNTKPSLHRAVFLELPQEQAKLLNL